MEEVLMKFHNVSYIDEDKISVVFFSLVAKVSSINKKFKGGIEAFIKNKYVNGVINGRIFIMCEMYGGPVAINDVIDELFEPNGIEYGKDYVMGLDERHEFSNHGKPLEWCKVPWLKSEILPEGNFVSYAKGKSNIKSNKPQKLTIKNETMQPIFITDNQYTDTEFVKRIYNDFELCDLSETIQKGLLFFMGSILPIAFLENEYKHNRSKQELKQDCIKCISLFASSSEKIDFDFESDTSFMSWIFSTNIIFYNYRPQINSELVNIFSDLEFGINKIELKNEMVYRYNRGGHLNTIHNLIEEMFDGIGRILSDKSYNNEKSYLTGLAFYNYYIQKDKYKIDIVLNMIHTFLTPLYKSFIQIPILHAIFPKELKSNHLFSNVLQMFLKGTDQRITLPIYQFHQRLFYKEGTTEFREHWDFYHLNQHELIRVC